MFAFRRVAAVTGMLVVLANLAAAPVLGHSEPLVEELQVTRTDVSALSLAPPPCQDKGYRLLGAKWTKTYEWSFKAKSTPTGLNKKAVAKILKRSFNNITDANNDCGRADKVSATDTYLGRTGRRPSCISRDGHNVVGFANLPRGVLAVTCYWLRHGNLVEADMKINKRESWALSLNGCHGDMPLLEATVTHEAGHVFGLDHVGEKRHGRLTMSPYLDGPCEDNEVTLGLGDLLGLEALY